jgi:large subunit ribosomal protein L41
MQPSPSLLARATTGIRRLRLTTKQVNGGYYKGTGSGSMGSHTKYGTYKIDWNKVRTYVVPDMTGFDVSEPKCILEKSRETNER